jgi:hypothetical protein
LVRREINDGAYNDLLDFLVHVRPIYGSLSNGCRELVSAHPLFKRWNQQRYRKGKPRAKRRKGGER